MDQSVVHTQSTNVAEGNRIKMQLKKIDTVMNEDELKTMIENLLLLSPSKNRALKLFSNKSWLLWIDSSTHIVYFQPVNEIAQFQNLSFGFKLYDTEPSPTPGSGRAGSPDRVGSKHSSPSGESEFPPVKRTRFPSGSEPITIPKAEDLWIGRIRYFYRGQRITVEKDKGLPSVFVDQMKSIADFIKVQKLGLKTEDLFTKNGPLHVLIDWLIHKQSIEQVVYKINIGRDYDIVLRGYTLVIYQLVGKIHTVEVEFEETDFPTTLHLRSVDFFEPNGKKTHHFNANDIRRYLFSHDDASLYKSLKRVICLFVKYKTSCIDIIEEQDDFIDGRLMVHPICIDLYPHMVLQNLLNCSPQRGKRIFISEVNFLNNSLQASRGVDGGGLTAQMYSMVAKHLFKPVKEYRIESRNVNILLPLIDMSMVHNLPFVPSNVPKDRIPDDFYMNIYHLFEFVLSKDINITRVLPDSFFVNLQILDEYYRESDFLHGDVYIKDCIEQLNSSEYFDQLSDFISECHGNHQENENNTFMNTFLNKYINNVTDTDHEFHWENENDQMSFFSGDLRRMIETISVIYSADDGSEPPWLNVEEYDKYFPANIKPGNDVAKVIFDTAWAFLRPIYEPSFIFILNIAKVAFHCDDYEHDFNSLKFHMDNLGDPYNISEMIQGKHFNRNDIANRIQCCYHPNFTPENRRILDEKAQFLRDHIMNPATEETWIKTLLFAITGSDTVNSSTSIQFNGVLFTGLCVAHTCTRTLDVGCISHVDAPLPNPANPESTRWNDAERFIQNLDIGIISNSTEFDLA